MDYFGSDLEIPVNLTIPSKQTKLGKYSKLEKSLNHSQGNFTDYFTLRNLSLFTTNLEMIPVICHRPRVSRGVLLPDKFSSPIFFLGQSMTVKCDSKSKILRKGQKKNEMVFKCEIHQNKDMKLICSSSEKIPPCLLIIVPLSVIIFSLKILYAVKFFFRKSADVTVVTNTQNNVIQNLS